MTIAAREVSIIVAEKITISAFRVLLMPVRAVLYVIGWPIGVLGVLIMLPGALLVFAADELALRFGEKE